jgi:hypothetical protein
MSLTLPSLPCTEVENNETTIIYKDGRTIEQGDSSRRLTIAARIYTLPRYKDLGITMFQCK